MHSLVHSKKSFFACIFLTLFCIIFAIFLVMTASISIRSLAMSKFKQYKLAYIREEIASKDLTDYLVYYFPEYQRNSDYATSVIRVFIEYADYLHNRNFTVFSDSGCYVWYEVNYEGGIFCKKKAFNISDNYNVIISEIGPINGNDVEKTYTVKKMQIPWYLKGFHNENVYIYVKRF